MLKVMIYVYNEYLFISRLNTCCWLILCDSKTCAFMGFIWPKKANIVKCARKEKKNIVVTFESRTKILLLIQNHFANPVEEV